MRTEKIVQEVLKLAVSKQQIMSKTKAKKIVTEVANEFLKKNPLGVSVKALHGKNVDIYYVDNDYYLVPKFEIESFSVSDLFYQLEDGLADSLEKKSVTQKEWTDFYNNNNLQKIEEFEGRLFHTPTDEQIKEFTQYSKVKPKSFKIAVVGEDLRNGKIQYSIISGNEEIAYINDDKIVYVASEDKIKNMLSDRTPKTSKNDFLFDVLVDFEKQSIRVK